MYSICTLGFLVWIRTRDSCVFFAEKFSEKIGVFVSKQSQILKKVDHNIGFFIKTPIFSTKMEENRRKL
jgi:hypothetical protein